MKISVAFDRAVIKSLCSLMGDAAGVFMLRVRDMLKSQGVNEDEANKLVNSFIAAYEAPCFDISAYTGGELSPNGAKIVRKALIDVIHDILDNDQDVIHRFVGRIANEIKKEFSSDLEVAIKELNEAIYGEPIEKCEISDDQLYIKLKRPADILAYTLANIRAEYPKLVSKRDSEYVFKK